MLCLRDLDHYKRQAFEYIVTRGWDERRILNTLGPEHPRGRFYGRLNSECRPVKVFDLGRIPHNSEDIRIYQMETDNGPARKSLNSALIRHFQHSFSAAAPDILFLNDKGQCEGNSNFWISKDRPASKLIISPVKIPFLGVQIVNGPERTDVSLNIGNRRRRVSLEPYETRQLVVRPARGFPWIKHSYRVAASTPGGSAVLVKVLPDDFRIGLGYYELGKWEAAASNLEKARGRDPYDWWTDYLLSRVHERLGSYGRTPGSKEGPEEPPDLFSRLAPPGGTVGDGEIWEDNFQRVTGFHPVWLEDRNSLTWTGETLREDIPANGEYNYFWGPSFRLAVGTYRVGIDATSDGRGSWPEGLSLLVYRNASLCLEQRLTAEELASGRPVGTIANERSGNEYAFMIRGNRGMTLPPLRVSIAPSLREWLSRILPEK